MSETCVAVSLDDMLMISEICEREKLPKKTIVSRMILNYYEKWLLS